MLTREQEQEISRLSGLWATARVRKALVAHGTGAPGESPFSVQERAKRANQALHEYLRSLLKEIDDKTRSCTN